MRVKKIFLLFFLCFNCLISNGQNLFYIGSKSYISTGSLVFVNQKFGGGFGAKELVGGTFSVVIAKNGKLGIIALESIGSEISGKAILYLDDNSTIILMDRGIHDYVDRQYTSVYYLTTLEIERLKKTNISSIRYNSNYEGHLVKNEDYKTTITETIPGTLKTPDGEIYRPTYETKTVVYPRIDFPKLITNLFE
jgi:hypothetical protein